MPVFAPSAHAAGTEPEPSGLAAGWLARTLAENGDLALTPAGTTDYASTVYALLGIRAAGVASTQITASADAMARSKEDFIGDPSQIDAKTTAIAFMILGLAAAEKDPSQFTGSDGTRDLYADLRSAVADDGSISSMPSVYGQSFALLALFTSPDGAPDIAVEWLQAQRCTDESSPGFGGYGFSTGSCDDADPDSTALAALALVATGGSSEALEPAGTFLLADQDPSGGFDSPFSGVNANTTGLAVAALTAIGSTSYVPAISQARAYLESLSYGCDLASDTTTAPRVGAMAYDSTSRASNPTGSLTPQTTATLFQATAQGMWGLIDQADIPPEFSQVSSKIPDWQSCPVASPASSASVTSSPTSDITPSSAATPADSSQPAPNWLWALGGFLVVILVYLGWRFLLSARRH